MSKATEVRGFKTSFRNGKKVHEVDTGSGYQVVSDKRFRTLTAAMRRRVKAQRQLAGESSVVVSGTGRLGRMNKPVARGHCWPMVSDALAVHPKQIEQAEARNRKHGINVTYERQAGCAIIPDNGEYKKLKKLEKVVQKNSFNG